MLRNLFARSNRWQAALASLGAVFAFVVVPLQAEDWPYWRGPSQNGISLDTNLPATWSDDPKEPENFLWKAPYGCRSAPIVMNGRVYINNQSGEGVNEQER